MGIDWDTNIVIAVDFDGTITKKDNYPDPSYEYDPVALRWIKKIKKLPVIVVLWTCSDQQKIEQIIDEMRQMGLVFDYINEYPGRGKARKINADVYIDDRANDGGIRWRRIYKQIKRRVSYVNKIRE